MNEGIPPSKRRKLNIVTDFNTIPATERIATIPKIVKPVQSSGVKRIGVVDLNGTKLGAQEITPAELDSFKRQRAQKEIGKKFLEKK